MSLQSSLEHILEEIKCLITLSGTIDTMVELTRPAEILTGNSGALGAPVGMEPLNIKTL
jgi:hypothetical protein